MEKTGIERHGFVFYHSFYDAIKNLPKKHQLDLYNAIMAYSLDGIIIPLDGINLSVFMLIKPQLDANNNRYLNGKKGGAPVGNNNANSKQEEKEPQPKNNQKQPKAKEKEKEKDKERKKERSADGATPCVLPFLDQKLSFKERKDAFWAMLQNYVEQYGIDLITAFYSYWSETSPNGKHLRMDGEKYFAVSNRLATWANRNKK